MEERDWDDVMIPVAMPLGLGTWVTDDPYLRCGLCGKVVAGAGEEDDIEFATVGELVDLIKTHAYAVHNG